MSSFDPQRRSTAPELMDTEPVSAADLAACLHDLGAVNTVTIARPPTLAFLRRAAARKPGPLSVLDVACGGGDMLRRIARWAAHTGRTVALTGVDLNPLCLAAARAQGGPIAYHQADAFDPALGRFDAVISSLFTHHLDDDAVVRFIKMMEQRSKIGWFVNDLHRHAIAYHAFRALSAAAGWHRFVRHDGPVSVARAFTRNDWSGLLRRAGVDGVAEVRWRLPFRFCVTRLK